MTTRELEHVIRVRYRNQRTLACPAEISGPGFLTGQNVHVRFLPAPPETGCVFVRTDLPLRVHVPATAEMVTGTQRRTTLGRPPAQIMLVEHCLAALAGLRIDNCIIELDAPEPPGLDGSARGFVTALNHAGTEVQPARRAVWAARNRISVGSGGATLTLYPPEPGDGEGLKISYSLDYGLGSPIDRQSHTQFVTPERFAADVASCRTFLLESEAHEFRRQGLGANLSLADLLVFGPRGPIDNALRFANEPARHKVLDIIGDLALLGVDLCGHLVAYRSGHPLNVRLARTIEEAMRSPAQLPFRLAA
jgi:UDP-3-O-[3-hydroxymyristoyl] N-acetylglucosamine deacetylase